MQRQTELWDILHAALECSVYAAPTSPGLTHVELIEVAKRFGYEEGEVRDMSQSFAMGKAGRLQPRADSQWSTFHWVEVPDYRHPAAFDFVHGELRDLGRKQGAAKAIIARSVLVDRGVQRGHDREKLEVAIAVMLFSQHLTQTGADLKLSSGHETYPLASEQLAQADRQPMPKAAREKVYPTIRDVVSRRTDGRPAAAEPLEAFAEALQQLGHPQFRLWWVQTVSELRQLDPVHTPTAAAVLSAALVEGALTFVVKHARAVSVGPFGSADYERAPNTWRIDEMVQSASKGGEHAVLSATVRNRAVELLKVRQRIHAGRMLTDHPGGAPDLRPEEARAARETVEILVRAVLDWLAKHPATTAAP